MIGKTISHYKIIEKLGEGGMGVVYKAQDTKLDRFVALKFLPQHITANDTEKARFQQEAKAAAALNHNNVCVIHDIQEYDGQQFIIMEYVDGVTLKQKIQERQLDLNEVIDYALQIAGALEAAHEQGIIHRDIKSENIMVNTKNQIKVMDFGLAKLKGSIQLTKSSSTIGTVAYMSPEQIKGQEIDARSDIYSFGVVLYEMLTGQLPFKGDYEAAVTYAIVNEEPDPIAKHRPDISSEFLHVLNRALEKEPENRYQNIRDVLIDLKRSIREITAEARDSLKEGLPAAKKQKARISPWKRIAIPILVLVLAVITFVLFRPMLFGDVLTSSPTPIAVISFENQTGDPSYEYLAKVIPNLLITDLEQSKYLRVTTWERMQDLLKQMGKEDVDTIDKDIGFQLCAMDGVNAIVLGSISKVGQMFVTDVKVLDVQTKDLLKSVRAKGEGEDSIIRRQIDILSKEISKGVGLSERKINSDQRLVPDVTTHSIDAYRYFLRGKEETNRKYAQEAVNFYQKAVELDSTFAIAYAYLGDAYHELGFYELGNEALEKAVRFSEKATQKEQYFIRILHSHYVLRDRQKTITIIQKTIARYPKEKLPLFILGVYRRIDQRYDEALDVFNKALVLDPDYGQALNEAAYCYYYIKNYDKALEYFNRYAMASPGNADPMDSMGELYFAMGRLDEALAKYKEAVELKSDYPSYGSIAYIYAFKEEYPQTRQWIDQYIRNCPSPRDQMNALRWKVFYDWWLGRIDEAYETIEQLKNLTQSTGDKLDQARMAWIAGWITYYTGKYDKARAYFHDRYAIMMNRSPQDAPYYNTEYIFHKGLIDIAEGQRDSVELKLLRLKALIPKNKSEDLDLMAYYQDFLQTEYLVEQGQYNKVIASRHKAFPEDLILRYWRTPFGNAPFIRDGLAKAYVRNGDLEKAIIEYEKLITRDLSGNNRRLIYPVYHYRLAKLYEDTGQRIKAIEAYGKFLEIWKDADKDLDEVADARSRLAALKKAF